MAVVLAVSTMTPASIWSVLWARQMLQATETTSPPTAMPASDTPTAS